MFPRIIFVEAPLRLDAELVLLAVPGVVELVPGETLGARELAALCRACREGRVATVCRSEAGRAVPFRWSRLEVTGADPVWIRDEPGITTTGSG